MRILLVTPPMVQFNTAYPAVPVLAAFLRSHGHDVFQEDLSLGLALRLFSAAGMGRVTRILRDRFQSRTRLPPSVRHVLAHASEIKACVPDVVRFLQGRAPELAAHFAKPDSVPLGPRFRALRGLCEGQPTDVLARHHCSVLLDEIADAVGAGIDDRFALARYAECLGTEGSTFDALAESLARQWTVIDRWIDELADDAMTRHRPDVVGVTIPFPGTLYGGFRVARRAKRARPGVVTVMGGGYVNTELRDLAEPRVFDSFDYVVYDDGEIPLLRIAEAKSRGEPSSGLVRTRLRQDGRVTLALDPSKPVLRHRDRPAPDFSTLSSAGYVAMAESPNPMHRLWSERPWIKLALAHGCYWHRCAFCDTSLDYIRNYDPAPADTIVGWMEKAIDDTGLRGFHFIDEAAPPALLGNLARALIKRGLQVEWWANIRFEKHFTAELAKLLTRSGCLATSGGLECAHDRLLALMDKGIRIAQAEEAMRNLSGAGMLVHAYLMYGYPTQSPQEIVDGLEFVRHLFASGYLHSAYWHRFALTAHSPAFADARKLKLRILDPRTSSFSRNEIPFDEPGRPDPGLFADGLRRAVYNFMHGVGLSADVRSWFDFPVPRPRRLALSAVRS